ncbi:polysaccharide lyase family 1 protein [Viridibacterium curvum]|uniref:Pectate lyase n=1 Tax=Viridibacterium curvum TaxID=1101404 RepID=A0ABP9R426_9RHOO
MYAPRLRQIAFALSLFGSTLAIAAPNSLGAFGWASANGGTTGGHGADKAHTYTVTTRAQLIKALMPDAVINADGSFTSAAGPDATKKIIYIKGKINLSQNLAGQELKYEHYKDPAFDFNAYVEAYKPAVWNANPANWDAAKNRPKLPTGPLEEARQRSADKQAAVVKIPVGSNTSIIGDGSADTVRIINGQLSVTNVSNVVIRNITFEDAFDYFPEWDPTDSFSLTTPATPGCQATYVDASTGPQKCPGGRWNSEYDTISVLNAKNVWIDHCSFNDGPREDWRYPSVFSAPHIGYDYLVQHHDGLVDVNGTSDYVTLSYNKFQNHDKTNLLGNSNTVSDANGWGHLTITVANNWYENAGQRLPRVRFGKVHVYNNYFYGTAGYLGQYAPADTSAQPSNRFLYGIGIGNFAKIYAENNVYEVKAANGVTVDDSVMFFNWYGANATINGVVEKTYFYDTGTILNGKARSITAAAQAKAVTQGKPALEDTRTIWSPSSNYVYAPLTSDKVKNHVQTKAGAGRL